MVDILRVPADCDGRTLSDTGIDGEDGPEGVCCDFMIGQCPLRARLEGAGIACSRRIKGVDGAQNGIDIFGTSAVVLVDIRIDILAIPIALQKAKDLRGLRNAANTRLANLCGKRVSFH